MGGFAVGDKIQLDTINGPHKPGGNAGVLTHITELGITIDTQQQIKFYPWVNIAVVWKFPHDQ